MFATDFLSLRDFTSAQVHHLIELAGEIKGRPEDFATALKGKTLQAVLTTGGPDTSYVTGGYNQFPIRDLLRPLEATAHLMGMTFAEPLVLYGVPNIPGLDAPDDPTPRIAGFADRYRALLAA